MLAQRVRDPKAFAFPKSDILPLALSFIKKEKDVYFLEQVKHLSLLLSDSFYTKILLFANFSAFI